MSRHTGRLKRVLSLLVATGAIAIAVPVSGASAYTLPSAFPLPTTGFAFPFPSPALSSFDIGGNQIGNAGCVGTNRPSVGGNAGSTSTQTCGAILAFTGPQIGQIASVVGPTLIGSPNAVVIVSAGPVTVMP